MTAIVLAAAMVITLAPASSSDAAKKLKLSKKTANISVGQTVKIKLKNAKKSTKVKWKSSKASVASIAKKVTKGKKAYASVKGKAEGKAKITATYKKGKKNKKLVCKVTVGAAGGKQNNSAPSPSAPSGNNVAPPANNTDVPGTTDKPNSTNKPTVKPSPKPTATPVPSPDAQVAKINKDITIDGKVDPAWDFTEAMPIKNWKADADAKKAQTSNGAVKMLWTDKYFYILVTADDPELDFGNAAPYNQDSVEIFFDEHNYKEEYGKHNEFQYRLVCNSQPAAGADPVGKFTEKSFWDGKDIESAVAKTDTGYACEFAIPLNDVPVEDQFAGVEVQINDASGGERNGTWNLFANPAAGDPVPYESTTVFGDCQYIIKREAKVIELVLDSEHCNMEKPEQFKTDPEGKYLDMNTKSRIDDENKWIYCNTANNLTVYFPEGRTVLNGEKAEVSIKGVYTASDTDTEETALFRIWMADSKQRTLVGDSPVTTSNQESVSVGTLNAGSDGEFEVNTTLIACEGSTDEGATSDGTCDAVMIKAPSWDAMIGDIIIKSVVITVYDPVEYVEPGKEPGEDEPGPDTSAEPKPNEVDFSAEQPYKNKDGDVTAEYSGGTYNITIPQFKGIGFEAPADMTCKYIEITYTSDSDLNTTLFDAGYQGSTDRGKPGEHSSDQKEETPVLKKAETETTLKIEAGENYQGNCIKAIKIAHIDFNNAAPKTIKIKSIKFFEAAPDA